MKATQVTNHALFINEEDAAMKGFDITSNLLGLEQLEYLDHHSPPSIQASPS